MRYKVGQGVLSSGPVGADSGHEIAETGPVVSVDQADDLWEGRGKRPCIRTAGIAAEFVGQDPERSGQFARVAGEVVEQRRGEAVGPLLGCLA